MKIICSQKNESLDVEKLDCSHTILQTLWTNSLYNNKALCSGIGKCAKCKVLFHSLAPSPSPDEIKLLSKEEIDRGIRLSCKHNAKSDYIIELLDNFPYSTDEKKPNFLDFSENIQEKNSLKEDELISACLALDFGTTTIEYELFDTKKTYAQGKRLNPMQGIGSEVMTRLEFAKKSEHAELLKQKTLFVLEQICKEALSAGFLVEKIIFSANTVMTYLAFGFNSSCLATAPYSLEFKGDCTLEFENLPPIYIPPLLAPFVGADISSGLFALKEQKELNYPYLYIDMGTNAEFALALSETEYFITSVPLGPSIEGVGLTFGTLASASSIVDFHISPQGIQAELIDKHAQKASGICGIGYLNLLSALKKLSILDKSGHYSVQESIPLVKKITQIFTHKGEACLKLGSDFYLSSSDIELILMVKSAFRTAFEILLYEASAIKNIEFTANSIKTIYLAGSLGKYCKTQSLTELGFLPNLPKQEIAQVGNMSLEGAKMLYVQDKQETIHQTFNNFNYIELADHELFKEYYIKHFSLVS